MEQLDFSSYKKTIPSIYKDIPVDLLCEFLAINAERQIKNMQDDPILKNHISKRANPEAFNDNRQRTHLDKEGFITWVLGLDYKFLEEEIQPLFIQYKQNLLKFFFQNTIDRDELFSQRALKERRISELETRLNENEDYLELMELRASVARIGKQVVSLDRSALSNQLSLFANISR